MHFFQIDLVSVVGVRPLVRCLATSCLAQQLPFQQVLEEGR